MGLGLEGPLHPLFCLPVWGVEMGEREQRDKKKQAEYFKAYYQRNRERIAERTKAYRQRNRERIAEYNRKHAQRAARCRLARRFGLPPGGYDSLLLAQGGGCGICGAKPPDKGRALHVDHCHHGRGQVRGLLCNRCNTLVLPAFELVALMTKKPLLGIARGNKNVYAYLTKRALSPELRVMLRETRARGDRKTTPTCPLNSQSAPPQETTACPNEP